MISFGSRSWISMARIRLWIHRLLRFYLSIPVIVLHYLLSPLPKLKPFPIFVPLVDSLLSLYFRYCGLSPCTIDLDGQTTMHFWATNHRRFVKPNLVMIHGYGANSRWQFICQVGSLSRDFNLYLPDLLFFGKSYTRSPDRTDVFHATCVGEGLKRLGVERCSVYALSYGGYVGYRMAEFYPDMVEKLVIASSGIVYTEEQKHELLQKIGRNPLDILVPDKPEDVRMLIKLGIYRYGGLLWIPDFFLLEFIEVMCKRYRKEMRDLANYLLNRKPSASDLPILNQETLLIWGDMDAVFPLFLAQQFQRYLGPRSKLEVVEGMGHASNIEAPGMLNKLITSFVHGEYSSSESSSSSLSSSESESPSSTSMSE